MRHSTDQGHKFEDKFFGSIRRKFPDLKYAFLRYDENSESYIYAVDDFDTYISKAFRIRKKILWIKYCKRDKLVVVCKTKGLSRVFK